MKWEDPSYCGVGLFRVTAEGPVSGNTWEGSPTRNTGPLSPGKSRYPSSPIELPEPKMPTWVQLGALDEMLGKGSGALTVKPGKILKGLRLAAKSCSHPWRKLGGRKGPYCETELLCKDEV